MTRSIHFRDNTSYQFRNTAHISNQTFSLIYSIQFSKFLHLLS